MPGTHRSSFQVEARRRCFDDWSDDSVPLAFEIIGDLDERALRRALVQLADRHETLRSGFERSGGQIVHAGVDIEIPRVSYATDQLSMICAELASDPFELSHPPLWRARLLDNDGRRVLVLVLSRLIYDEPSGAVIRDELAALYGEETGGDVAALPPVQQWGEWALGERRATVKVNDAQWWRRALDVAPPSWPPLDPDRPAASVAVRALPDDLLIGPVFPGGNVISPAILHAALAASLLDDLPSGNVVLGMVVSRRTPGAGPTVGMMSDVLPIPISVPFGADAATLMEETRLAMRSAEIRWSGSASPILDGAARTLQRDSASLVHLLVSCTRRMPRLWRQAGPVTRLVPVPLDLSRLAPATGRPSLWDTLRFDVTASGATGYLVGLDVRGPLARFRPPDLTDRAHALSRVVTEIITDPEWRVRSPLPVG